MTDQQPHTPIGVHQEVLQAYIAQGGTIERFYEWFDATQGRAERRGRNEEREGIAAAEQRGAEKALRDAAHDWEYTLDNIPRTGVEVGGWLLARADQMEGNDE